MHNRNNPFTVAEQLYRQLVALHQSGELSEASFHEQQAACVVQDTQGRRWFPAPEPGRWLLWDGQTWTTYQPPAPASAAQPARRLPVRRGRHHYPAVQQKKDHAWIGWVVGLFLFLVLLGVAGYFLWQTPLSEQLGLRQSAAVRLLDQPDRNTAQELALELSLERDTPGVYYYVLPVKNSSDRILYVIADASAGFDGISVLGSSSYAILDYLVQLASSKTVSGTGIVRIALDYRDEQGVQVGVVTALASDLLAYASQQMTRDELMQVLEGRANPNRPKATPTPQLRETVQP